MTRHHDDNPKRSHREIVAYLKEAGPVRVGDFEYDGLYLSSIVAVNPANLHHEATITPSSWPSWAGWSRPPGTP